MQLTDILYGIGAAAALIGFAISLKVEDDRSRNSTEDNLTSKIIVIIMVLLSLVAYGIYGIVSLLT